MVPGFITISYNRKKTIPDTVYFGPRQWGCCYILEDYISPENGRGWNNYDSWRF